MQLYHVNRVNNSPNDRTRQGQLSNTSNVLLVNKSHLNTSLFDGLSLTKGANFRE